MRRILLFPLLLACLTTSAQQIKLGGGGNLAALQLETPDFLGFDRESQISFQFNLFVEVPFTDIIALNTGISLITNDYLFSVFNRDLQQFPVVSTRELNVRSLQLPVMVRAYSGSDDFRLFAEVGGYAGLHTAASSEWRISSPLGDLSGSEDLSIGTGANDDWRPFDFGLSAGFGFSFQRVELFIRYDHGLADVVNGDDDYSAFTRRVTASLAYTVFKN